MKKIKQITLLGIVGFVLLQAAKATAIQHNLDQQITTATGDTTLENDSIINNQPQLNDPKASFKNMLSAALNEDGASEARLNPMAISFVKNYIAKNGKGFLKMNDWAKGYFSMMDEVLEEHGIPRELKYLAVIESGLKYNAKSWSGAVGPWAFMPAAAKQYGLKITRGHDERLDYRKSTHAAARLLTDLYDKYGDWLLVIAAYNSGPGWVDKAIKKSGGSKDFWKLQYYLPNETMNHVKKFIGAHYIFEGEGGVTTVTKSEAKKLMMDNTASLAKEEMENSVAYKISGRFSSAIITKYTGLDMETFNRFNPGFDNEIALNGKYELRLPTEKMNIFVAKRYEILDESVQSLLRSTDISSK